MGRPFPALSSLPLPLGCGRGPLTPDPDPGRQPRPSLPTRRRPPSGQDLRLPGPLHGATCSFWAEAGPEGAEPQGRSRPPPATQRAATPQHVPPRPATPTALPRRRAVPAPAPPSPAQPRPAQPCPKLQTRELPREDRPPGQRLGTAPRGRSAAALAVSGPSTELSAEPHLSQRGDVERRDRRKGLTRVRWKRASDA